MKKDLKSINSGITMYYFCNKKDNYKRMEILMPTKLSSFKERGDSFLAYPLQFTHLTTYTTWHDKLANKHLISLTIYYILYYNNNLFSLNPYT
jgi:hypothetical protein